MIISIVFWTLVLVVAACDIAAIIGLVTISDKNIKRFRIRTLNQKINRNVELYLVISLFNEKDGIKDTIEYFSKFIGRNVKLILITTEKEKRVFGKNRTAIEVNRLLKDHNNKENIITINYPFEHGNKGAQLNYMLSEMRDELDRENSYIMVYDCDSRPDKNTIRELLELISTNDLKVIQQSTDYTVNYDDVSPFMRVEAVFQTIRALGIERKNYFLSCIPGCTKIFMPYAYCVGHGMCFNCKYLYSIDCFPEPNEDVPTGMKLMLLGQGIIPLVSRDHGKVVKNMRMLFFQSGNWIKAPFQYKKVMAEIDKIKKVSQYRKSLFIFLVLIDLLSWFQYGLLLITCITLFILGKLSLGIFGLTVLLVFPIIQLCICVIQNKMRITWREILLSPLRNIFRGMALISTVYQKIKISYNEMGR